MKPGTIVRLEDGREGTVVYHGLDGYGIQFGRVPVDVDVILSGNADAAQTDDQRDYIPQAMLRDTGDPKMNAQLWPGLECVGEEYEVVS